MLPRGRVAFTITSLLGFAAAAQAAGVGHATPEEVVAKVRDAARFLAEAGGDGLERFKGPGSDYVWKDSYVFVADCAKRTIVAHPLMPERDGQPIAAGPSYDGVTAAARAEGQCVAARHPGGGWVAYPFPKPGEPRPSRKVTYLLAVPGTPYVVGAGVYDATVAPRDLDALTAAPR